MITIHLITVMYIILFCNLFGGNSQVMTSLVHTQIILRLFLVGTSNVGNGFHNKR